MTEFEEAIGDNLGEQPIEGLDFSSKKVAVQPTRLITVSPDIKPKTTIELGTAPRQFNEMRERQRAAGTGTIVTAQELRGRFAVGRKH